jgi:hypothetical protein
MSTVGLLSACGSAMLHQGIVTYFVNDALVWINHASRSSESDIDKKSPPLIVKFNQHQQ